MTHVAVCGCPIPPEVESGEVESLGWHLTANHPQTHTERLLRHYANREPKAFLQYDVFNYPHETSDPDGDELWAGLTYELMEGSEARVLIPRGADAASSARMLRKLADWIDRSGLFDPDSEDVPF